MPGANCSIFGCSTSRRKSGVSIFKLPSGEDDLSRKTREEWVNQITRNRVIDADLRRQINEGKLHVCEKHFEEKFIEKHATRKRLLPGAIPTLNLPQKSFETETKPRRPLKRHDTPEGSPAASTSIEESSRIYKHLDDFKRRVGAVKLPNWLRKEHEQKFIFEYFDGKHALPVYSLIVDSGLGFSITVFGWFLPDDHEIYLEHKRSLFHVTISALCEAVQSFIVCSGLDQPPVSAATLNSTTTNHYVPLQTDVYDETGPPFQVDLFLRPNDCSVLCNANKCNTCLNYMVKEGKKKCVPAKQSLPIKDKAPLTACSKDRLIATVQKQRLVCKDLKSQINAMSRDILTNSIKIDKTLENDILGILNENDLKSSPHMNLFWQQQKKLLASPKFGRRYHPHVIRFCLSLHSKSPSAYRELTSSGVLVLPSERVLRDYRNYFKPKPGFNKESISRLKDITNQLFDVQRYVVVSFDEMKIQSNLVFDKHSNELIGFVDLGDEVSNAAAFDKPTAMATHVLAFMVRGIASDLKYILGYFSTNNLTSYQIMPVFWKAVSILELSCNLWVCAAVSDGASPNRKFYDLHIGLTGADHTGDVIHKTVNLFAPSRFIYFFSDAPHLVKTARNCLFSSGFGKHTRLMWNGKELIWGHISELYHSDVEQALHQLPKLTPDHINLTSFSKMKVSLAVQVLSKTVALGLRRHFPDGQADETAKFCEMVNSFFDCLNVRSTTEHTRKRNEFLAPYTNAEDSRFEWLQNTFIAYLDAWYKATQERQGSFNGDARARMFISQQTYRGLKITVNSIVEVIQFLLSEGMEYVLSERFCQDLLEEYFGRQRERGRFSDNPTLQAFGYNDLTLAVQRNIAPVVKGNVAGRHKGECSKWYVVSEEPLPRRKKSKKN